MRTLILLLAAVAPSWAADPVGTKITYSVTGTATSANLTYRNATGGTEQHHVALPWNLQLQAVSGQFLYLSAQSKDKRRTIRVAISSDKGELRNAESSGDYVIAAVHDKLK